MEIIKPEFKGFEECELQDHVGLGVEDCITFIHNDTLTYFKRKEVFEYLDGDGNWCEDDLSEEYKHHLTQLKYNWGCSYDYFIGESINFGYTTIFRRRKEK